MHPIRLSFSTCPNDTFIFDAMVHGKNDTEGLSFEYDMADDEELNRRAFSKIPEMTKLSFHAWLYLRDDYHLLDSGSALGFGNGPLLISKREIKPEELTDFVVAIPGEFTTAHLLLKIAVPGIKRIQIMLFHEIEKAVLEGSVGAGVIIHENRFTYEGKGLKKILDLGDYWTNMTGAPIPLGGIVVRKDLGVDLITKLERIMYRSVSYAMNNPEGPMDFVRAHAQEMNEDVMKKHIHLYVNDYTSGLGSEGQHAIRVLIERSEQFTTKERSDTIKANPISDESYVDTP